MGCLWTRLCFTGGEHCLFRSCGKFTLHAYPKSTGQRECLTLEEVTKHGQVYISGEGNPRRNGDTGKQIICCCLITQSHLTLCHPMDCSPPGSSVHGISQSRILEWVAISFSRFPDPGIEPMSPASPALSGRFFTTEPPGKPQISHKHLQNSEP